MSEVNDVTVRLALAALFHYRDYSGADEFIEEYFPNRDVLSVLVSEDEDRTSKDDLIEVLEILKQAVKERTNG